MMESKRPILVIFLVFLAFSRATKLGDWLEGQKLEERDNNPGHVQSQNSWNMGSRDNAGSKAKNTDCTSAQQKFVDLNIGESSLTVASKTHDSDMDICYKGYLDIKKQSCCTRTMEREYQSAAIADFYKVLQSTSLYLTNLLKDNAAHYQEQFLILLADAHNKTERQLSEVYHLPLMDRWGPTESLFLDLQAYLRQREVSIYKSIETFFDELFPLVFHNNVNDPRSSQLDDDYRDCLMEIRKEITPPPFGGIPTKLSHQVSKAFGSARAFIDALKIGIKIVNTTAHMPLGQTCQDAVTRLEYCGHCDGFTDSLPCKGFCYNVMRGCFAHVVDMNIDWNEMISALELLTTNMRGSQDIEEVLLSFHTKVSEAIMHAMETGMRFGRKVQDRCGHPKSRKSVSDSDVAPPVLTKPTLNAALLPTPRAQNNRLYAKIEMFMRNVVEAKGFFSHLPDVMCTSDKFSAGLDGPCWNGEDTAPYNKSIMTKDLSAQKQNPELDILDRPHPVLVGLTQDMQAMKKLLSSKVSLEHMQGDQPAIQGDDPSVYYGSYGDNYNSNDGSDTWGGYSSGDWYKGNQGGGYYGGSQGGYYGYGGPMDDEDWYGSGSGYASGYGPIRPVPPPGVRTSSRPHGEVPVDDRDFTLDGAEKSNTPYITRNPNNNGLVLQSSQGRATPSVTVILFLAITLLLNRLR